MQVQCNDQMVCSLINVRNTTIFFQKMMIKMWWMGEVIKAIKAGHTLEHLVAKLTAMRAHLLSRCFSWADIFHENFTS